MVSCQVLWWQGSAEVVSCSVLSPWGGRSGEVAAGGVAVGMPCGPVGGTCHSRKRLPSSCPLANAHCNYTYALYKSYPSLVILPILSQNWICSRCPYMQPLHEGMHIGGPYGDADSWMTHSDS